MFGALKTLVEKIVAMLADTDRGVIGFIGGIWKSKKLGLTALIDGVVCYGAWEFFRVEQHLLALGCLTLATVLTSAYVLGQSLVEMMGKAKEVANGLDG